MPGARVLGTIGLGLTLALSALLPHLSLVGVGVGRSLIPAELYFLDVKAVDIPSTDLAGAALGVNVAYLGLALHQFGLVLSVLTFWLLGTNDFNRWLYRMLVVGGWVLLLSAPLIIWAYTILRNAGVPVSLGWAWLPTMGAAIAIVVGCRRSRGRVDMTWYVAKPELQ